MADYTRGDDPVYKEFRESHQYNQLQDVNREIDELTYELDEYQALGTVEELTALKAKTFCANGCPIEQERNEYRKLGSIGELMELVKAHKDGRATILPCKVGDTVYYNSFGKTYKGICHAITIHKNSVQVHLYDYDGDNASISTKAVFLTPEEAKQR